nr:alpha/beta hydrolase [Treponema sp.]
GYCMVVPPEAEIVAKTFYERGLNAFVLTYTTDITMSVPLKKQPLNDIARAVRFIRTHASDYSLTNKLIINGGSAGGHVCASLAVHFDDVPDLNPKYKDISARPDGVILNYPVITTGEFTHIYSVWALLGQNAPAEEMEYFSLEKNVKPDTPPCFIWQTATDDLVPVENSYLFAAALKEKGVPFAHYVFPSGFHGLSVATEDFFKGNFGEPYTMEQVDRAVKAVKEGKGVNVSDQRRKELEAQFADDAPKPPTPPETPAQMAEKFRDVAMWPDLAAVWIASLRS